MAFTKSVTLRTSAQGCYFVLTAFRCDDLSHEAMGIFSLYANKEAAVAQPDFPLVPIAVKVFVKGARYEEFFSRSALRNRAAAGLTIEPRAIMYEYALQYGVIGDAEYGEPTQDAPGFTAAFKGAVKT